MVVTAMEEGSRGGGMGLLGGPGIVGGSGSGPGAMTPSIAHAWSADGIQMSTALSPS